MSRVHYGVTDGGDGRLTRLIRQYLGSMVGELLQEAAGENVPLSALQEIAIVGNTVMHHIFCGHDLSSLARCPFETPHLAEHRFTSRELDWAVAGAPLVRFLPCIGGFIGSDLLAGMVATRIDQTPQLQVLVDLGTNGEIVVAGAQEILCAATAAGPAFEGARIQMGMRASCGAIDRVSIAELNDYRELQCHVIGGGAPTGICGSGLIDAAACALELGKLAPNGRLIHGSDRLQLAGSVFLHQCDFRELQLAKGAIAAGLEILLSRLGNAWEDVEDVFICGAFGNYLAVDNARRLGLLPFPVEKVVAMGNTALLGSKLALLTGDDFTGRVANIYRRVEQVGLSENKGFMDVYIRHMPFPAG